MSMSERHVDPDQRDAYGLPVHLHAALGACAAAVAAALPEVPARNEDEGSGH